MSTLYRLYRPQTFSDFVGQETSRRILQNALVYNRTVHSYLFTGPRGTGKTSMARIFAKALNCDALQTETGEVCNACTSCVSITEGSFVDLIEIDAASNRGIDEIRNLREAVRFAPSKKNGTKVYIIDEAHMLTKDASNALLKTLEEPPKDVYFVLVTTDADKLLSTIHSRVQTLSFYPLTHSQLKDKLTRILSYEGIQADDEVLQQIIVQAEGGARNAESLLGQLLSATNTSHITSDVAEPILGQNTQHEAYSLISLIADQNLTEAITFVNDLYSKGVAFGPFVDTLILTMRRILLARVSPDLILTSDLLDTDYQWIATLKDRLSPSQSEQIIRELRDAKAHLNTALTPQLPLEVSLTKLIAESATPSSGQQTPQSDASASQTPSSAAHHSSSAQFASSAESQSPSSQSQPQNSEPAAPTSTPEPATEEASTPTPSQAETPPSQSTESSSSESITSHSLGSYMPQIQQVLDAEHASLAPLFEECRPSSVQDSIITFHIPSTFKKRKLDQYRNTIENVIEQVCGSSYRVQFDSSDLANPQTSNASATKHVAEEPASYEPQTTNAGPAQSSAQPAEVSQTQDRSKDKSLDSPDEVQEAVEDIFQKYL